MAIGRWVVGLLGFALIAPPAFAAGLGHAEATAILERFTAIPELTNRCEPLQILAIVEGIGQPLNVGPAPGGTVAAQGANVALAYFACGEAILTTNFYFDDEIGWFLLLTSLGEGLIVIVPAAGPIVRRGDF